MKLPKYYFKNAVFYLITIGYQVLINVLTLRLAQAMCPLLTMLVVGKLGWEND